MIKLKEILNEKQQLNEKKKLDQKHLDKLNKMTQSNNHLGARTHLSYYLEGGNKGKFFKYYDAASQINDVFGHTPPELSKLNQKMEKEFYKAIKKKFANSAEVIGLL